MGQPRPNAATVEVERRFLVRQIPFCVDAFPSRALEQGYLNGTSDELHVRVRQRANRYTLTIKHGSGVVRTEVEVELDEERARALWPLTAGRRLEKVRYTVPLGTYQVEVDVFTGALAGLILCEVEFPTLEEANRFEPPAWFGNEVTSDVRFSNFNLARTQTIPVLST